MRARDNLLRRRVPAPAVVRNKQNIDNQLGLFLLLEIVAGGGDDGIDDRRAKYWIFDCANLRAKPRAARSRWSSAIAQVALQEQDETRRSQIASSSRQRRRVLRAEEIKFRVRRQKQREAAQRPASISPAAAAVVVVAGIASSR